MIPEVLCPELRDHSYLELLLGHLLQMKIQHYRAQGLDQTDPWPMCIPEPIKERQGIRQKQQIFNLMTTQIMFCCIQGS